MSSMSSSSAPSSALFSLAKLRVSLVRFFLDSNSSAVTKSSERFETRTSSQDPPTSFGCEMLAIFIAPAARSWST